MFHIYVGILIILIIIILGKFFRKSILKEIPCESRLCWLDDSACTHSEILYMVSPERRESKGENARAHREGRKKCFP